MRLYDIYDQDKRKVLEDKGYEVPGYDREALKVRTKEAPVWLHFGAGNIFRAYQCDLLEQLL